MTCTEAEHLPLCAENMKSKKIERKSEMYKRKKIRVVAAICLISCMASAFNMVFPTFAETGFTPISETFDDETIGALPTGYKANFVDGTITVENYMGSNCIVVSKTSEGSMSTLTRTFPKISDIGVEVKFDFLQKSVKSDGTTVFALLCDSTEIVKIETNSGNISFKKSDGKYEVLVPSYLVNKWYSFTVNADLANGVITAYVDGSRVLFNMPLTKSGNYCNSISFYSKNSPGFAIDNVGIKTTNKPDKIVVEGNSKATVPITGINRYKYKATIFDDYGAESGETIDWDLSPAGITGIFLNKSGKTAEISISDETSYNGVLQLTAYCVGDESIRKTSDILLVDSVISKIEIEGEPKLAYGLKSNNKFKYTYKMFDQYGTEQENEAVVMKIKGKAPEVELDATNGTITVLEPIENERHITLAVYYAQDKSIKAEKTLTLMDLETYKDDQARMDILCDAIENVIEYAKDIYSGTPLLASAIDLHTGRSPVYKSRTAGTLTIMSNLAQDSVLYRAFDAAAALTGRTDFSDKVDEIYQWYLDNGIDPYNMGYWGGHRYIDLLTAKNFSCEGNENTHELKNTGFYAEPFFRLDSDRAYSLVKTMWGGHIGSAARWTDLIANRHAYVDSSRGPSIAASTAIWDTPDVFDDANKEWIRDCEDIPFRSIGDDLATVAATAYKETGDETAKLWAYRILQQYYKRRDPKTGIIPHIYSTARNAKGVDNPDAVDPDWWKKPTADGTGFVSPAYGDRFFNQFALDLVNQGFYDSSVLDANDTRLTEGNYFSNSDEMGTSIIHDLQIAKALGDDSEEAAEIRRLISISLASYLKYAWIKDTDKIYQIMADGTKLTGLRPSRNGQYGQFYANGGSLGTATMNVSVFPSVCACYEIAKHDKSLSEQADMFWKYLKFFSAYYGLGTLGANDIGDSGMKLNFATSASSPQLLMAVTDLYYSTENNEFLKLARRIAENMISTYYRYGIFARQSNTGILPSQYYIVKIGAQNADKYYSLCYLEAAIRGDRNLIPEYYPFDGYVQGYYEYNYNNIIARTFIDQTTDKDKYGAVEAEELIIDDVIYLKPGETKKLEYQLLPDDITNKSIVCESENKKIVRVNKDDMSLIGINKGTANLIVCSNEFNIVKNVKVIVTEEVPNEENN